MTDSPMTYYSSLNWKGRLFHLLDPIQWTQRNRQLFLNSLPISLPILFLSRLVFRCIIRSLILWLSITELLLSLWLKASANDD